MDYEIEHLMFKNYLKELKEKLITDSRMLEMGANIFPSDHHIDFQFPNYLRKGSSGGYPIPYKNMGKLPNEEKTSDWRVVLCYWLNKINRSDMISEVKKNLDIE